MGKVTKTFGFSLLIKKFINVQSPCGRPPPPHPAALNRLKTAKLCLSIITPPETCKQRVLGLILPKSLNSFSSLTCIIYV